MKILVSILLVSLCQGFVVEKPKQCSIIPTTTTTSLHLASRRSFLTVASSTVMAGLLTAQPANAGIDPSLLKSLPVQGDESGASQRLRQIESIQRPASDLVDVPFNELSSGVSYREYREGKGEAGTCL